MTTTARRPDLRNDIEFQLAHDIRELGKEMVRLDTWMQQARKREEWEQYGDLERQRLGVQYHRSQLMLEAFAWRRKR